MRCRFALFAFFCLVTVNCLSARDEDHGGSRSQGSQGFEREGVLDSGKFSTPSTARDGQGSHNEGRSSDSQRNYDNQDTNTRRHETNGGSSFNRSPQNSASIGNRPSFETGHSSGRPTGQSNTGGSSHHSTGFSSNNQHSSRPSESFGFSNNREENTRPGSGSETFSNRPQGGSFHGQSSEHRPEGHLSGRPTGGSSHIGSQQGSSSSGFRPDNIEGNQHGRPTGGSSHIGGQEGSRPSGFGSGNTEGNQHGRPIGGSSHIGGQEGSRPSGFGSGSTEGNQHGRPTGGSSHIGGQEGGRPSGLRPDNAGGNQHGRPTGGSSGSLSHNEGNLGSTGFRPSNEMGQFGRPTSESTHNQQGGGLRPTDHEGQSGHSPTGSNSNQFTTGRPSEETGSSNHKVTGDGKEDEDDVCFQPLGCFKMGKPWKSILRPIGPPHGPERIQTTIHFYSRENLEKPINITVHPNVNMGNVRFDPSKITVIIVHGFSNSGNATWMKDMKNAYLRKVDANVMIVDWGKGAQLLNYFQVAGNTRVVGKQLGLLVKYLRDNYGADPGKFHLIGHSLGAQICSYLGKETPGIARLTALDPAQPGFEGFDAELRLDKTDAEFVDVIHTDARPFIPTLGFGMIAPHGHVDFYMNGGYDQPGCVPPPKKELPSVKNILDLAKYPVEVIAKTVACPHGRAYEYLIEAFNETEKCIFWGHKADVKNVLTSVTNTVTQGLLKKFTALSTTCSKEDCIPVGFATKKSPLRGVFVVTTGNRSPYCISEPGIPPETPPQARQQESFIQKIGKRSGLLG